MNPPLSQEGTVFTESEASVLAVITIAYFIFLIGVSVWIGIKQIRTYDDYNVASRNVSLFPLILTYVGTAIGGSLLLGIMTNGYTLGMGEQWFNVVILLASLIMAVFLIKRIRKLGDAHNYVTIGDFTAHRFGRAARIPTALSVLTAYASITGMQFVAIGLVLNLVAGVPMTTAIIVSAIMLTLKTVFGGLKAVVWQDAFHGTIQTVAVFGLFVLVMVTAGDFDQIRANAEALGEVEMLSPMNIGFTEVAVYALTVGAYQLVRQDLWQRAWAGKSLKVVTTGYWISIVLMTVTVVMVVWMGVWARYGLQIESEDPSLIYYELISHLLPFELVIVLIVALLATVISCADSFFMCGASSIVNDVIRPLLPGKPDQKTLLRWSRISVVITGVVALALALAVPRLVELWVTGTAMLVSGLLFPAVVALYAKKVSGRGAITAMWVGLGISVGWTLVSLGFDNPVHPVFLGFPASILTYIVFHVIDRGRLVDFAGLSPEEDAAALDDAEATQTVR
nr:sodium:solute symporter family protein [Sediminivirga luteola]